MASVIDFRTKIVFGKDAIESLPHLLQENHAKKVLLFYGGGSIKQNGVYDQTVRELKRAGVVYGEFGGIEPNPRHTTIDKAAEKVKTEGFDFILAVGGGSVVDAAKVVGAAAAHDWKTCWQLVKLEVKLEHHPVPVGAIITLAATASENNNGSVVTNLEVMEKRGVPTVPPVFAIENPEFTYTVNAWQTASGAYDAFCHVFEQFFGARAFDYSNYVGFGLLKTLVKNVPLALANPRDYEVRANLLITSSFALNHVYNFRRDELGGDWLVHQLEHAISALWDVTHGAGLALVTPTYFRFAIRKSSEFKQKLAYLGKEVYGVEGAEATIQAIENMIANWKLPRKYTDFREITSVRDQDYDLLTQHIQRFGALNPSRAEIKEIFKGIPV